MNQKQQIGMGSSSTTSSSSSSSHLLESALSLLTYSDGVEEVILAENLPKKNAGRKKFKETRHPVYRGVRSRKNDKWVCEVREPGNKKNSRIWLGTYETAEMAARAHDVAALALRGRSACLNFADSIWKLPIPESNDIKDIQKAASEAAQMFRQSSRMSPDDNVSKEKNNNNVLYWDEEAEFAMPGYLASMAEGLLLSPPPLPLNVGCHDQFNYENIDIDHVEEVSLWSFSD
ncbi:hypothetical protein AQUCO_02800229v1 [Aquilegia coerulea]|uniref:AP2/ERF domain-containing protein n=1 Tax=Aquilegia coerulea TaxID=218851 RepID=A0A2G5D4E4_AQUCA|nr:hypothetical protein AQUCO_02800229v1 [Aquilegia coerulea]